MPVGLGGDGEAPPKGTTGTTTTSHKFTILVGPMIWQPTSITTTTKPTVNATSLSAIRGPETAAVCITIPIRMSHGSAPWYMDPRMKRTKHFVPSRNSSANLTVAIAIDPILGIYSRVKHQHSQQVTMNVFLPLERVDIPTRAQR